MLYVREPDASLILSIYQLMPLTGEERLLGRSVVPLEQLQHKSIELWGKQYSLSGGGRVELTAQYISFDESDEQASVDLALLGEQFQKGELSWVANKLGGALAAPGPTPAAASAPKPASPVGVGGG